MECCRQRAQQLEQRTSTPRCDETRRNSFGRVPVGRLRVLPSNRQRPRSSNAGFKTERRGGGGRERNLRRRRHRRHPADGRSFLVIFDRTLAWTAPMRLFITRGDQLGTTSSFSPACPGQPTEHTRCAYLIPRKKPSTGPPQGRHLAATFFTESAGKYSPSFLVLSELLSQPPMNTARLPMH